MSTDIPSTAAFTSGEAGTCEHVPSNPPGWMGTPADPRSPLGAGGPGRFASPGISMAAPTDSAIPTSPLGTVDGGSIPLDSKPAPKPPNTPPATNPRSLGSQKSAQNDQQDVEVTAEVVADGTTTDANVSAKTNFVIPGASAPGYAAGPDGNIKKFAAKFVWKGNIAIKTTYGPGNDPTTLSCYGRGTTTADIASRDITLGFHENCHRDDYVAYLKNNALPEPPTMTIGMKATDYDAEVKRFVKELADYTPAMKADSESSTDDVGHTKATWKSTGTCYVHQLP